VAKPAPPPPSVPAKADTSNPAQQIVEQLSPVLRPERKSEAVRIVGALVSKFHHGPLPAPEDLEAYENTCPGAAERILAMAERNQGHRHSLERATLDANVDLQTRGQRLAITALVAMLLLIGFTFYLGQPIAGSLLGGATIVAVVSMFLSGRGASNDDEDDEPAPPQRPQPRGSRRKRG
jgi:uncharacterized membrane protein